MAPANKHCDFSWRDRCRIDYANNYANFLSKLNLHQRLVHPSVHRCCRSESPFSSTGRTSHQCALPREHRRQNSTSSHIQKQKRSSCHNRTSPQDSRVENSIQNLTFAIKRHEVLTKVTLTKIERLGAQVHHVRNLCEGINRSVDQLLFENSVHNEEREAAAVFIPNLSKLKVQNTSNANTDLTL